MTNYYSLTTLGTGNDDDSVLIEDYVVGLEMLDWQANIGRRLAEDWPADATIVLRKTSGRKLTDMLGTIKNKLFVSPLFRFVLERHCQGVHIEYLPFVLRDHRKRLLSSDYVIVNPIGTVDCLDLKASKISWDQDEPTKARLVHTPVLSASKLQHAPPLFRIREEPSDLVISYDLAKDLLESKLTNIAWEKLEITP